MKEDLTSLDRNSYCIKSVSALSSDVTQLRLLMSCRVC